MFTLDSVVPWGRSFDEYRRMFALTEDDLGRRMLGCGDGPASFNAEATARGCLVTSFDPLYGFDRSQIEARISATYDQVLAQTRLNAHEFVWGEGIADVEELGRVRMTAMQAFLDDFEASHRESRGAEDLSAVALAKADARAKADAKVRGCPTEGVGARKHVRTAD
jgi:hypothetical protein